MPPFLLLNLEPFQYRKQTAQYLARAGAEPLWHQALEGLHGALDVGWQARRRRDGHGHGGLRRARRGGWLHAAHGDLEELLDRVRRVMAKRRNAQARADAQRVAL